MHLAHTEKVNKLGDYGNSQESNRIWKDYLSYYLNEYTFRYNRRKSNSRVLLIQRLIEQGILHKPIEYKSIKSMWYVHTPFNLN